MAADMVIRSSTGTSSRGGSGQFVNTNWLVILPTDVMPNVLEIQIRSARDLKLRAVAIPCNT
jgi:hypothetical protein